MSTAAEIISQSRQLVEENLPKHKVKLKNTKEKGKCVGRMTVRVESTQVLIEPWDYYAAEFISKHPTFISEVLEVQDLGSGKHAVGFTEENVPSVEMAVETAIDFACIAAGCQQGRECALKRKR